MTLFSDVTSFLMMIVILASIAGLLKVGVQVFIDGIVEPEKPLDRYVTLATLALIIVFCTNRVFF